MNTLILPLATWPGPAGCICTMLARLTTRHILPLSERPAILATCAVDHLIRAWRGTADAQNGRPAPILAKERPTGSRPRVCERPRETRSMKLLWTALAVLLCASGPALGAEARQAAPARATPVPAQKAVDASASTEGSAYIKWLEERSMLHQAQQLAERYAGNPVQWQHPYGTPQPRAATARASVWFTAYPASTIAKSPGASVLDTLAD